jgi:hypothetical protein
VTMAVFLSVMDPTPGVSCALKRLACRNSALKCTLDNRYQPVSNRFFCLNKSFQ